MKFNIQFTFTRFPLRNMHRAVDMMAESNMIKVAFPKTPTIASSIVNVPNSFINRNISDNEEQKRAVRLICFSQFFPGFHNFKFLGGQYFV